MPAKPAKTRRSVATGAKLLIAAAALGGTLGAWATLSIIQDQTADADAPTAVVADAPVDPWADFAAALPPLPTVAALQNRPLVFVSGTPPPVPDAPQVADKPTPEPPVAAAPPKSVALAPAPARPVQQPAAPAPPPAPTLRAVDAPPPPPPPPMVVNAPAPQPVAASASSAKKSASAPAPQPVTKTRSSK